MADTTSYDIIHAIIALDPSATISVVGEDYDQITWGEHGNPLDITIDQIKEKQVELKAEYDAQEYARNRQSEYPSIEECVHAILDDQLDALQEKRTAIKAKYPKG